MNQGRVGEIPGMRMSRIDPAKSGEELSGFELKVERQTRRLHEGFLDLDFGLVVVVQLEHDVGEALKVGIDGAVERELDVARVETALLWIVIAHFDTIEIARARVSQRE